MKKNKIQLIELVLVLSVAFLPAILISLYTLLTDIPISESSSTSIPRYLNYIVQALLSISLMFYILLKQEKPYSFIGLNLKLTGRDFAIAIALVFITSWASYLFVAVVNIFYPGLMVQATNPKNVEFLKTNHAFILIVIAFIIPLKEELIVRGFAMAEIFELTGNRKMAVIISVLVQFTYHLYQGFPSALASLPIFLIFAVFFLKTEKLNPVILAHIFIDLLVIYRRNR